MRSFQKQQAERKAAILGFQRMDAPVPDEPEDPRQIYILATILRNAMVIGLCVCAALVLALAAQQIMPGGYVGLLPILCVLVAVDLLVLAPQLSRLPVFSKEWFLHNGSRWVLIITTMKLLTYVGNEDWMQIVRDLPLLRSDPYRYFFSGPFLILLLSVFVVWAMARTLGFDLSQLTEGEKKMEVLPEAGMRTDRVVWRQNLCSHVLGFGAFIAAIAAGTFWLSQINKRELNAIWISLDLLVYFAIGLALLGHTHLTVLRTNWLWERTPIASNLVRRWTLYGLAFLGGLAFLALVLPVGSLDLLLPALNFLFQLLFYIAQFIAFVFVGLAHLVLALLSSLMGQPTAALPPVPPPMAPFNNVPAVENVPMPAWYETLQIIIFFVILLIIFGYVLRYAILQHRGLREALSKLPIVIWLQAFWRGLRRMLQAAKDELALWTAPSNAQTLPVTSDPAEHELWSDSDHLLSREQVIALYLQTVQAAKQHGQPRQPAQTPVEYAQMLATALPDTASDVAALTEQFNEARYSAHGVPPEQASLARQYAQRVIRWLKRSQYAQLFK